MGFGCAGMVAYLITYGGEGFGCAGMVAYLIIMEERGLVVQVLGASH